MSGKSLALLNGCLLHKPNQSWKDHFAVGFWQKFMSSAPAVKPPNILIVSGNDQHQFQRYQQIFKNILWPNCYAVYHYEEKCRWNTWMDNTCLLVLTKSLQESDDHLINYIRNGGHLLALGTNIPSKLIEICQRTKSSENSSVLTNESVLYRSVNGGILLELAQEWTSQRLVSVLQTFWNIQCCSNGTSDSLTLTTGHLVSENPNLDIFKHPKLILTDDVNHPVADKLPVLIGCDPSTFDVKSYFQHLQTRALGRTVLYCQVMTSTHWLLEDAHSLPNGMAVISRYQTNGRGRSGNIWMSPEGCAVFSLRLEFALESMLGKHLSLMQHLAALAIILAVKSLPCSQAVPVGIKWPNDIYIDKRSKVGGILATTTLLGSRVLLNLGCGLNLDNARPTVGLNDTLERCGSPRLTMEHYVALVFNQLENLLHLLAEGRLEQILELYHRHWLHSGSQVTVTEHDGNQYSAQVVGIDRFGFLRVRKECGMEITVHPDGNSFDMIQGLVVPK